VTIKPHVRIWRGAAMTDCARASDVEIEGFLPNSVLRLAGFKIHSEAPLSEEAERRKFVELLEHSLVQFLRRTFPECHVTLSPATMLPSS
jgi:hypothetical protein